MREIGDTADPLPKKARKVTTESGAINVFSLPHLLFTA